MLAGAVHRTRIAPSASTGTAVAAMFEDQRDHDTPGVSIPRPEIHVVVRFGGSARNGLDVHAIGTGQRVHRKIFRGGQRTLTARLHLGAHEAVLGVPASEITGTIVALEELWGAAATGRLLDGLGDARDRMDAAAILERAIAARLVDAKQRRTAAQLALQAAPLLTSATVSAVAIDLGVSERHLRRVFRETVGVSPKTFARLARFRHALRAARTDHRASWAGVASAAGYYDQAHLIAEFRAIAGVTPQAFLHELGTALSIGG